MKTIGNLAILAMLAYANLTFALGVERGAQYTYNILDPTSKPGSVIGQSTIKYISIDLRENKKYLKRSDRYVFWRGHAGVGSKICGADDIYYCFYGPPFTYSWPKAGAEVGAKWTFKGLNFSVAEKIEYSVFGKSLSLYVVFQTKNGKPEKYFLYSKSNGLVGIGYPQNKSMPIFYLLHEEYGFPF
jgi:hypothetical protein